MGAEVPAVVSGRGTRRAPHAAADDLARVGVYSYCGFQTSEASSTAPATPPRQTGLAIRLTQIAHVLPAFCIRGKHEFAIRTEHPGVVATLAPSIAYMVGRSGRNGKHRLCAGGCTHCRSRTAVTPRLALKVCSSGRAKTK